MSISEEQYCNDEIGRLNHELNNTYAELERVKRQNAAMRDALEWVNSSCDVVVGNETWDLQAEEIQYHITPALRSDAGRDYIAKESVRPLVEALRKAYTEINTIHARCGVPWWDTGKSDVAQEYFTSVVEESRSALDVARQLGLP